MTKFKFPDDWRGKMMKRISELFKEADPEVLEDVKWRTKTNPDGVLVWYHDGMISTGEIYKKHLRLGFAKGSVLKNHDPKGLINSYRAIILKEEDKLDEKAFKDLARTAVELNIKHTSELPNKKK